MAGGASDRTSSSKATSGASKEDLQQPGGYPKFVNEGYNKKLLPAWLQDAGYRTYYAGKLMNHHSTDNYKHGLEDMALTGHDFMIEPSQYECLKARHDQKADGDSGTYQYVNTTIQHNMNEPSHNYTGQCATGILTNLSRVWIDNAAKGIALFFLAVNPVNPHNNMDWHDGHHIWTPPLPAERHKDDFPLVKSSLASASVDTMWRIRWPFATIHMGMRQIMTMKDRSPPKKWSGG